MRKIPEYQKGLRSIAECKKSLRKFTEYKKSLRMFTDYEQKLHMFTYCKQVYVCLLRKGSACLLIMSRSYILLLEINWGLRKIIEYKKVHKFLLHMSMVYTYILIDSISEFYTYLLLDVVGVDVYLCTFVLCTSL